jgi:hypothetical protein
VHLSSKSKSAGQIANILCEVELVIERRCTEDDGSAFSISQQPAIVPQRFDA